jgi:4-hydroxythreonine-4-phosphate dehydrogenase
MPSSPVPVAITMGDPAGVGPETIVRALGSGELAGKILPVVVGTSAIFERAVRLTNAGIELRPFEEKSPPRRAKRGVAYMVIPEELGRGGSARHASGRGSLAGRGRASFACVKEAVRLCATGHASALVTAPISKASLSAAGLSYAGHTEMLRSLCRSKNTVMMFVYETLRISLVTTHIPMRFLTREVDRQGVDTTIRLTSRGLERLFGIRTPRLAVLALNPHAGEDGVLGTEERDVLEPVIRAATRRGLRVKGPFSADSFFSRGKWRDFDATVAMYHDQALIAAKLVGGDAVVNLTIGLPFVRTSPGHGTARDIAWQGIARPEGMVKSTLLAAKLTQKARLPLRWNA